PFVLFFEGLARSDAVDAAFIHKTLVIWVALLAAPLLHERIELRHGIAIGLLVTGQVVLAGWPLDLGWGLGEAMIGAATLLWACEMIVARRLLTAGVHAPELAVWRMLGGAVALVGWLVVRGSFPELLALNGSAWAWILFTGALLSGYVATFYASLERAPALDVAAVLVVGAVVTALLQTVVDGVALGGNVGGLALLVLGAAVIASRHFGEIGRTWRRPEPAA
ncbi:MAG: drug/metabolite transporter (DMT)-like permease, partial [Glaciecola sp.]